MIVAEAFVRRPLSEDPGDLTGFAPEEKRYLGSLADPRGSIAARRLAKERIAALLTALGHPLEPEQVAVLPGGEPGQAPPVARLPEGAEAAWGLRARVSLSHSAASAAALVIVETLD